MPQPTSSTCMSPANSDGCRLIPGGREAAGVKMLHRRQAIGAEALGSSPRWRNAASMRPRTPVRVQWSWTSADRSAIYIFSAMIKKLISRPSAGALDHVARARREIIAADCRDAERRGWRLFVARLRRPRIFEKGLGLVQVFGDAKPAAPSAETISSTEPRKLVEGSLAHGWGKSGCPAGPAADPAIA